MVTQLQLNRLRLPKADRPVSAPMLPREIISRARLAERMPMTGMGWGAETQVPATYVGKQPLVCVMVFGGNAPCVSH